MGEALNTTVNGSAGTCTVAADVLDGVVAAVQAAATDIFNGRSLAESSWHGPAYGWFCLDTDGLDDDLDSLHGPLTESARALRDFADSLDGVNQQMQHAIELAAA